VERRKNSSVDYFNKLIAFALIILGLYVGLQTTILSDNVFSANMWDASKTVVNQIILR
jgi:hypothetical protein